MNTSPRSISRISEEPGAFVVFRLANEEIVFRNQFLWDYADRLRFWHGEAIFIGDAGVTLGVEILTRAAQGEYLTAPGVATQMVQ